MSPIIQLNDAEKEIIAHAYETHGWVEVAADTPEERIAAKGLVAKGLASEMAPRVIALDGTPHFKLELTPLGERRAKEELDGGFQPSD